MQSDRPQKLCTKCGRSILITRCKGSQNSSQLNSSSRMRMRQSSKKNLSNFQPGDEQKIPCHFCGYMQSLTQLDTHPDQCQHRDKKCQYCDQPFPLSLMDDHLQICDVRRQMMHQNHEQEPRQRSQRIRHHHHPINPYQMESRRQLFGGPNGLFGMMNEGFFNRQRQQPFQIVLSRGDGQVQIISGRGQHNMHNLITLIEALAMRNNHNNNPGLSKQQMDKFQTKQYKKTKQQNDLCTICYCELQPGQKIVELPCKHIYHPECVFKWLEKNSLCPVCKQDTRGKQSRQREEENEDLEDRLF